jgi:hypothetical protein
MTQTHLSEVLAGLRQCDPGYDRNILNYYHVGSLTEIQDVNFEKIMTAINSRKQKLINDHFEKTTVEVAHA